jgi:hypothetical protein
MALRVCRDSKNRNMICGETEIQGNQRRSQFFSERTDVMTNETKVFWLRRILVVKAFLTVFIWGLPALVGPVSLLEILKIPIPSDPLFLRLFGGAATAWGVAYWLAHRNPEKNVAIIQAGLVDNALPTLAVVVIGFTTGVSSLFIWISAVLTGMFFLLFLILMPRQGKAGVEASEAGAV